MAVDYLALSNAKAKGKRPQYFDDPAIDKLVAMLLATIQELGVTRERLDTVERLLESKDVVSRADIDAYRPDAEAAEHRGLAQRELISRVMRIVEQERYAMEDTEKSAEELADEFSRD